MTGSAGVDVTDAYIELLKRSLIGANLGTVRYYLPLTEAPGRLRAAVARWLARRGGTVIARPVTLDLEAADDGSLFASFLPPGVISMVGRRRMDNLEFCLRDVVARRVPGDVIETGVWRGGSTILMRGVLQALGDGERRVYVADSFQGLPAPDPERYPRDRAMDLHLQPSLAVSLSEVKDNFRRFGLLDDRVVFLEGWFRDTLPGLAGHTWSLVRLDGDMYESTYDALSNLYDGLSEGGWLIVDDYHIPACRDAVTDFRRSRGIDDPITEIDWTGIFWQKSSR